MARPKPHRTVLNLLTQGFSVAYIAMKINKTPDRIRHIIKELYDQHGIPTDNDTYDPRTLLILRQIANPNAGKGAPADQSAAPTPGAHAFFDRRRQKDDHGGVPESDPNPYRNNAWQ